MATGRVGVPTEGQNYILNVAESLVSSNTRVLVQTGVRISAVNGDVYVGLVNTVTTSNGFPIFQGTAESFDGAFFANDLRNLYLISNGNVDVRYWGV